MGLHVRRRKPCQETGSTSCTRCGIRVARSGARPAACKFVSLCRVPCSVARSRARSRSHDRLEGPLDSPTSPPNPRTQPHSQRSPAPPHRQPTRDQTTALCTHTLITHARTHEAARRSPGGLHSTGGVETSAPTARTLNTNPTAAGPGSQEQPPHTPLPPPPPLNPGGAGGVASRCCPPAGGRRTRASRCRRALR